MTEIGVRELKARASEILRQVREEGASYTVTYRGRPVGVLLPISDAPSQEPANDAWDNLERLGKELAEGWPPGLNSSDVISEMRR